MFIFSFPSWQKRQAWVIVSAVSSSQCLWGLHLLHPTATTPRYIKCSCFCFPMWYRLGTVLQYLTYRTFEKSVLKQNELLIDFYFIHCSVVWWGPAHMLYSCFFSSTAPWVCRRLNSGYPSQHPPTLNEKWLTLQLCCIWGGQMTHGRW